MANNSGLYFKPNEIQNNQTTSSNFDDSHIICGQIQSQPTWTSDQIHFKGQLVIDNTFPLEIDNLTVNQRILLQNGATIEGLSDPILDSEPVNLGYLNNLLQNTIEVNNVVVNGTLSGLQDPTLDSEPVNLGYLNNQLQNTLEVNNVLVNGTITGLQNPILDSEPVNLGYLNNQLQNTLEVNDIVVNGTITGLQTPIQSSEPVTLGYLQQQQAYAQSDVQVGTIQAWIKPTIPVDFLLCDGSAFSMLEYPELFQVLGTTVLPDLRQRFLRGDQTGLTPGQNVAQVVGLEPHTHTYNEAGIVVTYTLDKIWAPLDDPRTYVSNIQGILVPSSTSVAGGGPLQDSYPSHTTVNFIIKARSTRAFRNSIQNDSLATASLIANTTNLQSNTILDMTSNKIINLQTPTVDSDAATKLYVDQAATGGVTINKLQNGLQQLILQPTELQSTVDLNMQSHKITNLTSGTLSSDAINLGQADAKYSTNTTPINQLTVATGSLNLNNQKITNLADATLQTDALNRQTGDNRYYLNTTPLQSITLASNQLNMNAQKISNMATGTLFNDAVILQQLQQWIALTTLINQTPTSATYVLPFQEVVQTSTEQLVWNPTLKCVTLLQAGTFAVQLTIKATYTNFNQPITIRVNSSITGVIQRSVTVQQPQANGQLTTSITNFIAPNVVPQDFKIEIVCNPAVVTINEGCYLLAQKLY